MKLNGMYIQYIKVQSSIEKLVNLNMEERMVANGKRRGRALKKKKVEVGFVL